MQEISINSRPARKPIPLVIIILVFVVGLWIFSTLIVSLWDATKSAPPPTQVNIANYQLIQVGMTYAEVCQILRGPGTETARSEIAGIKTEIYAWQSDGIGNMNVMFQNGRMILKAQAGLK